MKVYLDVCCLCRPFDDQKINRIHREAEAVKEILQRCTQDWTLVTSDAVSFEISRIPDITRMKKAQNFMDLATEHAAITKTVARRYHECVEMGIDSDPSLFSFPYSRGSWYTVSFSRRLWAKQKAPPITILQIWKTVCNISGKKRSER